MTNEAHPFLPSGWRDLPDPYQAAAARVTQKAQAAQFVVSGSQTTMESRLRKLEATAERTRQMVDGATIACAGGGVTLTWGAD